MAEIQVTVAYPIVVTFDDKDYDVNDSTSKEKLLEDAFKMSEQILETSSIKPIVVSVKHNNQDIDFEE